MDCNFSVIMNKYLLTIVIYLFVQPVFAAVNTSLSDPTRPDQVVHQDTIAVGQEKTRKNKSAGVKKPVTLVLQQTIIAGSRRYAVINGKMLSAGDQILGIKVKAIEAGKVIILQKGKTKELRLTPDLNFKEAAR